MGAWTGRIQTHLSRLDQDVPAGDFEATYVESFRRWLRRGWRLIASQLPHYGKDTVCVGAVIVAVVPCRLPMLRQQFSAVCMSEKTE
jgi:hypothetical protein